MIDKIISGGQTGADRGGLDAAIELGIEHGGWCPKGRRAEDGRVPLKYVLREHPSPDYPLRTARNIIESDGTIVFVEDFETAGPGSRLTIQFALTSKKPCFVVELGSPPSASKIRGWIRKYAIKTLNVAGSRESSRPGIQAIVRNILIETLKQAR